MVTYTTAIKHMSSFFDIYPTSMPPILDYRSVSTVCAKSDHLASSCLP